MTSEQESVDEFARELWVAQRWTTALETMSESLEAQLMEQTREDWDSGELAEFIYQRYTKIAQTLTDAGYVKVILA